MNANPIPFRLHCILPQWTTPWMMTIDYSQKSVLRTVSVTASVATYKISHTVRSTNVDNVIYLLFRVCNRQMKCVSHCQTQCRGVPRGIELPSHVTELRSAPTENRRRKKPPPCANCLLPRQLAPSARRHVGCRMNHIMRGTRAWGCVLLEHDPP